MSSENAMFQRFFKQIPPTVGIEKNNGRHVNDFTGILNTIMQVIHTISATIKKKFKSNKIQRTYFPMFSGSACREISFTERHVRFCNSGKLSGNLWRY